MSDFNADTFWADRVEESVKHIQEIYKRNVTIDRGYKDGLAKVMLDGKFIVVTRNDDISLLNVVDVICSMLTFFRNEQIDDLQKRFSALFD